MTKMQIVINIYVTEIENWLYLGMINLRIAPGGTTKYSMTAKHNPLLKYNFSCRRRNILNCFLSFKAIVKFILRLWAYFKRRINWNIKELSTPHHFIKLLFSQINTQNLFFVLFRFFKLSLYRFSSFRYYCFYQHYNNLYLYFIAMPLYYKATST